MMKFILTFLWLLPIAIALLAGFALRKLSRYAPWVLWSGQILLFALLAWVGVMLALEVECSAAKPWLQELGVNYHLAANEISLLMMFMGGLGTCVVLSSCSNERIGRACLCLALEGLCFGALLSEDALLLLSFLGFISPVVGLLLYEERENLPVLAAWRSAFILFAMGSFFLLGILLQVVDAYNLSGEQWSFQLTYLVEKAADSPRFIFIGLCFLIAGWIGMGLWPFHHWMIAASSKSISTALSLLLMWRSVAFYLFIRFAMPYLIQWEEVWQKSLFILGGVGIAHGMLVAYAHSDLRSKMVFSLHCLGIVTVFAILSGTLAGILGALANLCFHSIAVLVFFVWHEDFCLAPTRPNSSRLSSLHFWSGIIACLTLVGMPGLGGFGGNILLAQAWADEMTSSSWHANLMLFTVCLVSLFLSIIWVKALAPLIGKAPEKANKPQALMNEFTRKHGALLPAWIILWGAIVWFNPLQNYLLKSGQSWVSFLQQQKCTRFSQQGHVHEVCQQWQLKHDTVSERRLKP